MIPIFIGWDRRETVAYHVLADSIIRNSSVPVSIAPVGNDTLGRVWYRDRGPHDSTDFSNARFMVPYLMGYTGWAIFMDCDMLCLGDVAELWAQRHDRFAVQVVKHRHEPRETTKFLGAEQSKYACKNWSSLMLLNCGHYATKRLSSEHVNIANGLDLHQFQWCPEEVVGEIRGLWNVLVAPELEHPEPIDRMKIKLLHYTLGGPWHGYDPDGAEQWMDGYERMICGGNPCASSRMFSDGPGVWKSVTQFKERFSHEKA